MPLFIDAGSSSSSIPRTNRPVKYIIIQTMMNVVPRKPCDQSPKPNARPSDNDSGIVSFPNAFKMCIIKQMQYFVGQTTSFSPETPCSWAPARWCRVQQSEVKHCCSPMLDASFCVCVLDRCVWSLLACAHCPNHVSSPIIRILVAVLHDTPSDASQVAAHA